MSEWRQSARYLAAREIVGRLRGAGHAAYFAGGCVRDMLLGLQAKDFDVATSATPDEVIGLFAKTFAVGAHFGVVLVCLGREVDGKEIATEVATFRNDGVYTDGRRPDAVRFSTEAREDVVRRDFTINGMLLDPVKLEETRRCTRGGAGLCGWARGSRGGGCAGDRGRAGAVCGGQAAHAAGGAVCGAARVRD